ncbi:protein CFT1 [Kwoniella bestiolae CBS 10118]|uniref:Protein CFT1 n=1 Tax=Kwoniella bestiolae CBS 10118 TaxID=1296100 RepID=A0A1B9GC44_9TREE|nr:protein CFT1 [Kwoniella bestiolae CBS 10118]OCF28584.1 protein CFT1 [Kwoniella bestiolae CBS 10118]
MHAFHQTLLPSSSIHHSLFLPNFTPSTIYPLPKPIDDTAPDVKVIGNLIVAGGENLRVFEIREFQQYPILQNGIVNGEGDEEMLEEGEERLGDGFFDDGNSKRDPVKLETRRKLHLLAQYDLNGTVTGLSGLRTIESSVDGLDRLLVSFEHAKMALLEWSRGSISTVSLHTYERCSQMVSGDVQTYVPMLRTDPLSRLAVLSLPEDSLAVLPVLQEQLELDLMEGYARDVPYSPSFVLSLSDVSPALKNLQDLLFLPGFHSPTLALLYSPLHTFSGRYQSIKDNYCLEIRTIDLSSGGTYPLLTSVTGLPSDSLYLVACPSELGGVVIVTSTGLVHIDQSGRVVGTSVNAWWSYATALKTDHESESRKISLEGSKCLFVNGRDMLLILQNGDTHQVRFEMDGRNVGQIKIDESTSTVPPPSSVVIAGDKALFVGSAEGDSLLAKINEDREVAVDGEGVKEEKVKDDMEVDWDEDLYGDMNDPSNAGLVNGHQKEATGPAKISVSTYDVLEGVGKIMDIEFGIAATDQGTRTYPQLVAISGGSKRSTLNVFRRGIPITKRRRFNELSSSEAVWFLPIDRPSAQKYKDIRDSEQTTMLFSTERNATRIFALSTKANPEQIGRIDGRTLNAAPFFQRSCVMHVTPSEVTLLDNNGRPIQVICPKSDLAPIMSASISDPYVVIRRKDGNVSFFVGDTVARTVSEGSIGGEGSETPKCQAIEVFSDTTGIYRTFEPSRAADTIQLDGQASTSRSNAIKHGQQSRMQLTQQQIKRLQEQEPAISVDAPSMETAMNASRGTQWLSLLTDRGELQIRSLPDLKVVLQSDGLGSSAPTFTDDLIDGVLKDDEIEDQVVQMAFCPIGKGTVRPHLLALHHSGRLNAYEAQPRFTVDSSTQTRRSLAVRFRKVHTQLLPISGGSTKLPYTIIPFDEIEGIIGAFITGEKPHWIVSSDAHPLRTYALKQAAMSFGKTTHLGGKGEYFIRIEDGSFICYLPPTLNTDFAIPCDRYDMDRVYTSIAFDPTSAHYVGAASIEVPFQAYDEEGEIQIGPEGENFIPPTNQRSTLELFSQGSDPWRVIDGYDFDQNEEVLCLESVTLESPGGEGGYRDFIAVGTGFNFGEDRATRGNTYIFEIVETVGKGKNTGSGWILKLRAKDPARNPVSAISHINGYLLNSNGPKLYVKGFDDDQQLMGLAFLDVQIYVTSIKVFKNFILVSDLYKNFWFIALQEDPYKLTTISKDLQPVSPVVTDFLVHESQMTFVSNDREGNMRMLDFDPTDPDSLNGERVLLRTEYHTGAPVTTSKVIARRKTAEEEYAPQTQIIYATADGALTTLVSVKSARFKRLQLVSDQLVRNAQHIAGLNPKAFRTVQNDLLPKPLSKGILDGTLLSYFALQPLNRQKEMMRQIGTDAVTVASDIAALGGFW